jgi:hypothetical protein
VESKSLHLYSNARVAKLVNAAVFKTELTRQIAGSNPATGNQKSTRNKPLKLVGASTSGNVNLGHAFKKYPFAGHAVRTDLWNK